MFEIFVPGHSCVVMCYMLKKILKKWQFFICLCYIIYSSLKWCVLYKTKQFLVQNCNLEK